MAHLDLIVVIGSAVVGLLVGMTGAGGGALMTPMLILLFSVKPSTAISSDLVAAVLMRPFGAAVHLARRTVNLRLVAWMSLGSVPMALIGTYILHLMGESEHAQSVVQHLLGAALLLGAAAMAARLLLMRHRGTAASVAARDLALRPAVTIGIGMVGGLVVGITSVGSGSLMIILLLFAYPMIAAKQLVGTDLTQAVPLTLAAAVGAAIFGHVSIPLTTSIAVGSVPAVIIGSLVSSRAPDRLIRPVIAFAILASGLKYSGVGTTQLGVILVAMVAVAAAVWLGRTVAGRRQPLEVASADRRSAAVLIDN